MLKRYAEHTAIVASSPDWLGTTLYEGIRPVTREAYTAARSSPLRRSDTDIDAAIAEGAAEHLGKQRSGVSDQVHRRRTVARLG